jgi:tetratricopeptide (TPR) repeat protein
MKTASNFFRWILLTGWLAAAAHSPAQQTPAEWMRQGDELDSKQQTKSALAAYQEAEKLGTPPAALLHRIAKQYGLSMNDEATEAGKKAAGERALAYAQRSVAADPKDADARVALAICYGRLLRFQETKVQIAWSRLIKESAEQGLRLNPKHELGCYVLGSWHYELAGLNPVKRGLARLIYGAMPPASYTEAAAYFQRAIALNPSRMASYVDLGMTYAELDDETAARQMLAKGLALPDRDRDDPMVRARGKQALADL